MHRVTWLAVMYACMLYFYCYVMWVVFCNTYFHRSFYFKLGLHLFLTIYMYIIYIHTDRYIYMYIYIYKYIYIYVYIYIYIYMVIGEKSLLSILCHLRVVNSAFLKQRFDGCLFQVSFHLYNFFIIYNLFYQSLYILHFITVSRSILNNIKKQLNTIK